MLILFVRLVPVPKGTRLYFSVRFSDLSLLQYKGRLMQFRHEQI